MLATLAYKGDHCPSKHREAGSDHDDAYDLGDLGDGQRVMTCLVLGEQRVAANKRGTYCILTVEVPCLEQRGL